jgi:hypothetical protein
MPYVHEENHCPKELNQTKQTAGPFILQCILFGVSNSRISRGGNDDLGDEINYPQIINNLFGEAQILSILEFGSITSPIQLNQMEIFLDKKSQHSHEYIVK